MPTSTEDPAQLLALGVAERRVAQRKLQTTLGTMLEKLAKENDRQAEGQWDLHGNLENLIAMLLEQNDRNAVIEKGLRKAVKKADRLGKSAMSILSAMPYPQTEAEVK